MPDEQQINIRGAVLGPKTAKLVDKLADNEDGAAEKAANAELEQGIKAAAENAGKNRLREIRALLSEVAEKVQLIIFNESENSPLAEIMKEDFLSAVFTFKEAKDNDQKRSAYVSLNRVMVSVDDHRSALLMPKVSK